MNKEDKEIFFLSLVTGILGSWAFMLGRTIQNAKEEEQRTMDDARIRFEHQQQQQDRQDGRDGT